MSHKQKCPVCGNEYKTRVRINKRGHDLTKNIAKEEDYQRHTHEGVAFLH